MIDLEDQYDNVETTDSSTVVTAILASGAGTLTGAKTATVTSGVASFNDLEDDTAGALTLRFAAGDLPPVTSEPSIVSPAPAKKLVFVTQPGNIVAGIKFGLTVDAEDSFGNTDTSYNGAVTVALANSSGGLGGATTENAASGAATFTDLIVTTSGAISLDASSGSLTAGTSGDIQVASEVATELVIHAQPSPTATAGQPLATEPVIYEEDQYGNPVTGDNSTVVTASLANGTGTLQGTISATMHGGVATFSGLTENTAGTVSLRFTGAGLRTAPTGPIVVSPALPSKLVIANEPSATAMAGQAFIAQPVILEEDQFGNLETADSASMVTASLASGSGPLQGSRTVTISQGVATFTNLGDSAPETIALRFAIGSLASPASTTIRVNPAPPPVAPTVVRASVLMTPKTKKKKAIFSGFAIQYSSSMNPTSAGLTANYDLNATATKVVKRKKSNRLVSVRFSPMYNQLTDTVTLTVVGKNPFTKGGQLTIVTSPPNGVSSQAGVSLNSSDTFFRISANAKNITLA